MPLQAGSRRRTSSLFSASIGHSAISQHASSGPMPILTRWACRTRQTAKGLDIGARLPCRGVTSRKAECRLRAQSATLVVFSVPPESFCGRVGVLPIGPFAGTGPRSAFAAITRSLLSIPRHHGNPIAFSSRRNCVTASPTCSSSSLAQTAKVLIEHLRKAYNTVRPDRSLEFRAPVPPARSACFGFASASVPGRSLGRATLGSV